MLEDMAREEHELARGAAQGARQRESLFVVGPDDGLIARMTDEGQSGQEPPTPPRSPQAGLLAEDDPSATAIIAKMLRGMGLEVNETRRRRPAPRGHHSYYKNGRSPDDLDLVITDVRMPVLSGLEIFKALRVAHWTLPVIVMTAFESKEVSDAVMRYGAALLIKPLDLDELEALVRRMLARPAFHRAARG